MAGQGKLDERIAEMRERNRKNRKRLSALGVAVVAIVALALVVPAISVTRDAATPAAGFYFGQIADDADFESYSPEGRGGEDEGAELQRTVLRASGDDYKVTASYGEDAGFPEGAELEVAEVTAEDAAYGKDYEDYVEDTEQALGMEAGSAGYIRLFDIKIVNGGEELQPAAGASVEVNIELADAESDDLGVVHFADGADQADVMESSTAYDAEASSVAFEAEGFSVYAVVDLTKPDDSAKSVDELNGASFYFALEQSGVNRYMTDRTAVANNHMLAEKSYALDSAAAFTFELTDEDEFGNNYYIYTSDEKGRKLFLNMIGTDSTNNGLDVDLSFDETASTKYKVELYDASTPGYFCIYHIERADVMNAGKKNEYRRYVYYTLNGNGNSQRFRGYQRAQNNATTNKDWPENIQLIHARSSAYDPYGLDGRELGILWNNDMTSGTGLMTTDGTLANQTVNLTDEYGNNVVDENGKNVTSKETIKVLRGQTATVRVEPMGREEIRYVANNTDITMWSLACCGPAQYYITAVVDGDLKYLRFDDTEARGTGNKGLSLVSDADERCKITVTPGIGSNSGKYKLSSCGQTLRLDGANFRTESNTTNNVNQWMYFVERSNLNDDDFVTYTAEKVSVSGAADENGAMVYDVENGDQVVIYTRIWNDSTLKYEYYAIDYNGKLVRAYESGDTIAWVGSKVNTMLWDFTEYYYDDGTPNFYYDLRNAYSRKYIAPQVSGGGFLSDDAIGLNLNGRRNGEYFTTVLAWDDPYYDYASLKTQGYQLVSAPISKADTFYFAKMKTEKAGGELSTVATIDHTQYGITVKMRDYNNDLNGRYRDKLQWDVMGDLNAKNGIDYSAGTGQKGLLTKNIDDSYPTATKTGTSLDALFSEADDVNQLFLESVYKETGYFEYDCTQNFAHLITSEQDKWYGEPRPDGGIYGIGDFVVYQQLGTTTQGGDDQKHGNFFPYNDITEDFIATNAANTGTLQRTPLSSLDARYGEKLYAIKYGQNGGTKWNGLSNQADYYFGMEMSASFMQTANGLDDWGHDLIFEFSGDDDFWLYIDDMLVLDLGGVHYAMSGSVNFRTGQVWCQTHYRDAYGKKEAMTTLSALYEAAYREKHADDEEALGEDAVRAWLDGIFKQGTSVFKDFSAHTVRMFYMERDAGASNLHMRFNLTPYTKGQVQLEKQVSGTEAVDASMGFPFQIRVKDTDAAGRSEEHLVGLKDAESSEAYPYEYALRDAQTGEPIPYRETYTVGGQVYDKVFILKPGQVALIDFPDENTEYSVTECGLDTAVFDSVRINDSLADGTQAGTGGRQDFTAEMSTVASRKRVIYDNHVSLDAQHSLVITKKLWKDFEKQQPYNDDETFRFRIYIGKDGDDYTVYNTGKYYVKDPDGNYCTYSDGAFVSTGKKVFSDLSGEELEGQWKSEQEQATFHTSPGGAADKIPVGYSVEIPELMEGTAFLVMERDGEIPAGYNLIDYERVGGVPDDERANAGVIRSKDERVVVNNQHGYGLVANKEWSDAPFMESHDPIYLAVYKRSGDELSLLEGSVRRLSGSTTLQWFFPDLEAGATLNDYEVYEVTLPLGYSITDGEESLPRGYTLRDDGTTVVLDDGAVEPARLEEGATLHVGGVTNELGYSDYYDYTVSYTRKELSEEQLGDPKVNSRTDVVSNTRPGIMLVKTDMEGQPLSGAKFTLEKHGLLGLRESKKTFTSNESGLIAVAYLTEGQTYTLTETSAPYQHLALASSLEIRVEDGKLYVDGNLAAPDGACYTLTQEPEPTADAMPTLSIMNRAFTLQAVKVDAADGRSPISKVGFALYREVTDYYSGDPMPDYEPMDGFGQLVTKEDGVIPKVNLDELGPGTYYLREVDRPTRYQMPDYDIRLTISETGEVGIQKAVSSYDTGTHSSNWDISDIADNEAAVEADENGNLTLKVKNTQAKGVQVLKVGDGNAENPLEGAEFALYKLAQLDEGNQPKDGEEPVLSGATRRDGLLDLGVLDGNVEYYLFETKAPAGYNMLAVPVRIISTGGKISAFADRQLDVQTVKDGDSEVMRIQVSNSSGYELPSTGGIGTRVFYVVGGLLVIAALAYFVRRSRK